MKEQSRFLKSWRLLHSAQPRPITYIHCTDERIGLEICSWYMHLCFIRLIVQCHKPSFSRCITMTSFCVYLPTVGDHWNNVQSSPPTLKLAHILQCAKFSFYISQNARKRNHLQKIRAVELAKIWIDTTFRYILCWRLVKSIGLAMWIAKKRTSCQVLWGASKHILSQLHLYSADIDCWWIGTKELWYYVKSFCPQYYEFPSHELLVTNYKTSHKNFQKTGNHWQNNCCFIYCSNSC